MSCDRSERLIEEGLVILIQSGLGTPPMAPGGWAAELPPNQISPDAPMAWTFRSLSNEDTVVLEGQDGFTSWDVDISCHGAKMSDAITLARAIQSVLRGSYAGQLLDSDGIVVQGIFSNGPSVDGFSDADRSYVRTLEYRIQYNQP